jgi:hypothetical protein
MCCTTTTSASALGLSDTKVGTFSQALPDGPSSAAGS